MKKLCLIFLTMFITFTISSCGVPHENCELTVDNFNDYFKIKIVHGEREICYGTNIGGIEVCMPSETATLKITPVNDEFRCIDCNVSVHGFSHDIYERDGISFYVPTHFIDMNIEITDAYGYIEWDESIDDNIEIS